MAAPYRSQEELLKLRVIDLRKELSNLALPTTGKKDDLVTRLYQHYIKEAQEAEKTDTSASTSEVVPESEPMEVDDDAERKRLEEEEKIAAEKAELDRLAEEQRIAAEKAEQEKLAEEQRMAAEKAELERLAEEQRIVAEKEQQRLAEEQRIAAEKAELERLAAEKAEQQRLAEEQRIAAKKAEQQRLAEEQRLAAEKAEQQRLVEEQRIAAEKIEQQRLAEEHRVAAEKAEQQRLAEEQRIAAEKAEQQRLGEEQRIAAEAEQARLAEIQRKAEEQKSIDQQMEEQQRLAREQQATAEDQQRIASAEQMRLSQEQEALQAVVHHKEENGQTQAREQEMMLLVQQQQTLLDKQKSAHDTNQRHARQLQEQRQQLEAALRQNSLLQSQHKGNLAMMEQLQQQRQQLLAQGEAISSQQSTVSDQANAYLEQRQRNERLMRQVMEQQQLKESEQQKMLLMERQQRLIAEHEQLQQAQQQAMEQQAKNAELLRQQQTALLEKQREQEEAARHMLEQQRREQAEAEQRRVLAMRREAELRAQKEKETAAAAAVAKLEAERKAQQEKSTAKAPPSLLTMDTKPATVGLKLPAGDSDRKLPKALEDVLALKDIRAKEVGVEDMEQAVEESRSTVTVRSTTEPQRPLGDVNEYDDDEEEDAKGSHTKDSKNKRRKKKKKTRAARKAEEKRAADERASEKKDMETEEDSGVEVEYIQEKPLVDVTNPLYSQFHKIFETFQIEEPVDAAADDDAAVEPIKPEKKAEPESGVPRRGAALFGELEDDDEPRVKKDADGKLSKKQMKKLTRMSVAELKTVVVRPDLVEMHDVTGPDPKLLLSLKATRNTVPVPRHWCNKRKYLQGKRGFEKPPFELPDYIQATGIMEMRQALADKESDKSMKQKMREKVRPKMGKIDIDYQKLHDAFFKYQRKPKMTVHGDLYYEGKEFETKLREKKPGNLTDELRTALGMPIGVGSDRFPPPWLIAMQRYGPPPSYPNLKIPGLNAAIPEGCSFGYHAGGWGKPPVDEMGKPLYGDVFGQRDEQEAEPVSEDTMDKAHWGEMESESEEESESESEEERDDDEMAAGLVTPADAGLITPSGLTSIPAGMETPDAIELRKKIEDSMDVGGGDTPALYQVLPEKRTSVGAAMMGSAHTYDVAAAKKVTAEGIEVTLNPEELDMDTVQMQAKYDQTVRQQQADIQKEDFSDMVAEHSAKAAKKRKKQQGSDKTSKKHKEFKF